MTVKTGQVQIYGAWLYKGKWGGVQAPPQEEWELLKVMPGRFADPPVGFEPQQGQVTLLCQGENCLVVTPEEA